MLKGSVLQEEKVAQDFYPFVENEDGVADGTMQVRHPARIAVYDDAAAAPRVVVVEPKDVREYLDDINNSRENMAKMERIKTALARLVARVQMGSISTDKGVLFWDGDGELEVGFNVYQENENGERVAAAEGEYVIEGGLVIIVAEGQVTEIRDVEDPAEQVPADEVQAEEVIVEEGEPVEEVVEEVVEETNDHDDRIDALEARIAELEGKLAELADRLAEYGRQPKGQPAHEAVKKAYSGDRADSFGKALKYARK
jgi:cell division septum initiation protein DivIVA